MKFWIFSIVFCLSICFSNHAVSKSYTVEVRTTKGLYNFAVNAPTDAHAYDSVLIGAVYSKRLGIPLKVIVQETGLSSDTLPQRAFEVTTEEKKYFLNLNVVNPDYVATAIQASKFVMSNSSARNILYNYTQKSLKEREAIKYTLKYASKDVSFMMNPNSIEDGRVALDIAATMSSRSLGYKFTYPTNYKCASVFMYY